jgi:hypothetical protein
MAVELQNKWGASTLDQAHGLAEPSLMRASDQESIHRVLDDLVGDFEDDNSFMCL